MNQKSTKTNNIFIITIIILVISIIIFICCFKDFFIIASQGLPYINKNQNKYFYNKIEIDDEIEFSLTLNESSKTLNKCIYDTNNCKIFITEFIANEETYIIFRACGQYSVKGAQLITCVNHNYVSENNENISLISTLICSYEDNYYECLQQGYTWCNFKDGNMFGYYLPKDLKSQIKNDNLEIKFHLKGLLKYIWNKK